MKTPALAAAFVAVLSMLPAPALAQQLTLRLHDGLVTLDAQNVPVRQILAEWARVGGARVVNGEKVMGGPVTLQLNGVPERQALDIILRGVSGYMLASRQGPGTGLSGFDRILIMPTSSAPRTTGGVQATAPFAARPTQTFGAPAESVEAPALVEDQDEPEEGDPDVAGEEEAPVVNPQPGLNRRFQRPPFPNPMGVQAQPFMPQGGAFGQPQPVDPDEETPTPPTPSPLNVPPGASTVPGVISPVPQQQDPQQPPNSRPRRPPA
jgi:hypothetical protein